MSSFQEQIDQAIKAQDLYFIGDQLPLDWYAGFKAWLPWRKAVMRGRWSTWATAT
ncbi:hypothetical protein OWT26_25305 [Burkholderia sp. 1A5]